MTTTTKKLVLTHLSEGIKLEVTPEMQTNVTLIVTALQDVGCTQRIGAVQLKSLLTGRQEECAGFTLDEEEISDEKLTPKDEGLVKEVEVERLSSGTSDEELQALLAEGDSEDLLEETLLDKPIIEVSKDSPEVSTEEKDKKANVEKAKKSLGITGDTNLTPASSTSTVRKPRRDLPKLLETARAGKNKDLISHLESNGFNMIGLDTKERWYYMVDENLKDQSVRSKRFDVSPRKNGSIGISVYVNKKAVGVRTVISKEDGVAGALKWMTTDPEVLKVEV